MGAGLDAHAHSASREMGALVAWGRGVGGWRLALGARLPPWDAGFCTEPGLQSWRGGDREALLLELRAAVVEHRGPLVTLNKPQGLPVTGKPGELTLLSVLPDLSQSLGCPSLQGDFWACAPFHLSPDSEPSPEVLHPLEESPQAHSHILVIPVKCPSRRDLLEGVKRTLSHFRVMATGSGCALIQLQPLTLFPSQLQVHMMLQLCPVLGDHTYSARAGTVLGQRFLLSAENTKPQRQALDDALLRRLHLTPAQAAQLPLHLHLHQLLLPGSRPADAPIELRAPLPRYFSRTLQCLGLCQQ
ncbi:PREDICTED: RNA pseudouridylate synthase domain-containing protein 3 isoform X3 [Chinchilla lanigera]|uniref:RNA pseudouridylate synthase domain-containing protein 3 isoform X3 n=1 Tax=Chinchilla lanigera TaxID=34839 RepID=UPI00038EC39C|nr:PREDICTED: RNA pseudouridylate synthase domain-containing protein 3 isoform X3 [Chinchilla lanigera]